MGFRKLHRALALFFGPFLMTSAVTGLLWAYSPYLYLKDAGKPKAFLTEANEGRMRVSPVEAIHAAREAGEKGKISAVTLRAEGEKAVYSVGFSSKEGPKEFRVDAETGAVLGAAPPRYPAFHQWVMKIHRLEFFGTKKELVAIPGLGLLAMLFTGLFLFKRGLK